MYKIKKGVSVETLVLSPELVAALQSIGAGKGLPGKSHNEEHNRHNSESHMGHPVSEETRKKISESHMDVPRGPMSEETKGRISKTKTGIPRSEEHSSNIAKSLHKRPTPDEMLVDTYLQKKFPGKWVYKGASYVGPRSSRKPDFMSVDGEEVISVFGGLGFSHFLDDEEDEVEYYKGLGIRCVVVWDRDIWTPGGLDKIFGSSNE